MRVKRRKDIDEVDDFFETLMRAGPFPGDDDDERQCNVILNKINEYKAGIGGDEIDAELLEDELRTAIIIMVHGGRDPTMVPYHHIRHAIEHPITMLINSKPERDGTYSLIGFHDGVPEDMRKSIKGPTRAIRTRCMGCMNGNINLIRDCSTVNCFLHPFRMGTNPFYGRIVDSDADAEVSDAELHEDISLQEEHDREEAERLDRMNVSKQDGD